MAIYLLDGRRCPALFTSGISPDGSPSRAVYWYHSSEGDPKPEQRSTNSLVIVPDDDGASWTAAKHPTAAHFCVIVPDDMPLQAVSNRLIAAYDNRKRAAEAAHENFFGPPLREQAVDASGQPAGPIVPAQPVAGPELAPPTPIYHPADENHSGEIGQKEADKYFKKTGQRVRVGPYDTSTGIA